MTGQKFLPLAAAAIFAFLPASGLAEESAAPQEWDFAVTLDGHPIGQHIFTLSRASAGKDALQLTSKADFAVSFFDIPFYVYHHMAQEEWRGGCLAHLSADTDDDGDKTRVTASGSGDGGEIAVAADPPQQSGWKGCLMTFSYWNPALRHQTRLLNPQSGEIEPVTITRQPARAVTAHGKEISADVWRIINAHAPIDVLYGPDGAWVGLDSIVKGGHLLSYRLP